MARSYKAAFTAARSACADGSYNAAWRAARGEPAAKTAKPNGDVGQKPDTTITQILHAGVSIPLKTHPPS